MADSSFFANLLEPVIKGLAEFHGVLIAGVAELLSELNDSVIFVWEKPHVVKMGLGEIVGSSGLPLVAMMLKVVGGESLVEHDVGSFCGSAASNKQDVEGCKKYGEKKNKITEKG